MFVSGPRLVRVGKAGQEADGGEVGGGGGGVGLRAVRLRVGRGRLRRWQSCGPAVWRRRRGLRRRPPACAFSSWGALGGVAGVWEARESGVWCRRFSAEQRKRMHTSGLLGAAAAGARRGPEQGQRAGASWGREQRPSGPASKRSRFPVRPSSAAPSASWKPAAAGEVPPAHAFWRALPRVQRCGGCVRSQHTLAPRLLRARFTFGRPGIAFPLFSGEPCTRGGRVSVSVHPEPTAARQEREEVLDDV